MCQSRCSLTSLTIWMNCDEPIISTSLIYSCQLPCQPRLTTIHTVVYISLLFTCLLLVCSPHSRHNWRRWFRTQICDVDGHPLFLHIVWNESQWINSQPILWLDQAALVSVWAQTWAYVRQTHSLTSVCALVTPVLYMYTYIYVVCIYVYIYVIYITVTCLSWLSTGLSRWWQEVRLGAADLGVDTTTAGSDNTSEYNSIIILLSVMINWSYM